jgi:EmrB/QacA subfamily drug resistance transporter
MTSPSVPGVDYSRKWLVMAAVAMGILLSTIDASIVNVALPTLERELDTTFAVLQWVVLGYLLTLATLTLVVGRLGDMIGKKPIYTWGFAVFTVASLACGLAPSVEWLIGLRVVQALGATMILALGIGILTESFPPSERGRALGLSGTVVTLGIVLGPTLGGILVDTLSWRWIFLVNLPVGIVGTWTARAWIPDLRPKGKQRFDPLGAVTLFVSLLSLLLALTLGQDLGFGAIPVIVLAGLSVVTAVAFVTIERRVEQPMVDLSLFSNRLLSINLITGFVTFVAIAGFLILLPFYLENVLGYEPRAVGLLLAAAPVTLGVVAPLSGWLSDRVGTRPITVLGLAVLVVTYFGVSTLSEDTSAVAYIFTLLPLGIGMGIFQSPNNSAVMGSVPPERLGVTSGLLALTRITGQVAGIAVLGALWAWRVSGYDAGAPEATEATPLAQVAGLQDVARYVAVAMAAALVLAAWGWWTEHSQARAATNAPS